MVVPGQGRGLPLHGGGGPGRQARAPDVVRDTASGARQVVEAELLPVLGSVARPLGPRPERRAAGARVGQSAGIGGAGGIKGVGAGRACTAGGLDATAAAERSSSSRRAVSVSGIGLVAVA